MKKRVFSALMAAALTASMVFGTVAATAEEKSNEDITIGISMCAIEVPDVGRVSVNNACNLR